MQSVSDFTSFLTFYLVAQAQELVAKGKKKVTQDELEGTTAILNRAINTMRPGNLAEMEDLRELSGLLRRAGCRCY